MLFTYTYVPHAIDKMQEFLDFVFADVWCKAPEAGSFCFELFGGKPELKELMEKLFYADTPSGDFFYRHVEQIFYEFSKLRPKQIAQLKIWYSGNNDIKQACSNARNSKIVNYEELIQTYPELGTLLKAFFYNLWGHPLLDLVNMKQAVGTVTEHYKAFTERNKKNICPFCGLYPIKGPHHSKRNAYDHYLPKSAYPFNSMNFNNLCPSCHECNSDYKRSKDPLHNNTRRKAFYPFAKDHLTIEITFSIQRASMDTMRPEDIDISFFPEVAREEINTWRDVYGIDERYKAWCCDSQGKHCLEQVLDEWRWYEEDPQGGGRTPDTFLKAIERQAERNPYAETIFLKKAFLRACKEKGLFDNLIVLGCGNLAENMPTSS